MYLLFEMVALFDDLLYCWCEGRVVLSAVACWYKCFGCGMDNREDGFVSCKRCVLSDVEVV